MRGAFVPLLPRRIHITISTFLFGTFVMFPSLQLALVDSHDVARVGICVVSFGCAGSIVCHPPFDNADLIAIGTVSQPVK